MTEQVPQVMDDAQRAKVLDQALGGDVAAGGRVQSHTPYAAVVIYGQKVNHLLHAVISIFTCGLWAFVWALLALTGGERRYSLTVDPYGNVHRRKV